MRFTMAFGNMNGLKLLIDRAGRLVVLKRLRDRLGLRPGIEIDIVETSNGLLLRPVRCRPSLMEQEGILVHVGDAPLDFDWNPRCSFGGLLIQPCQQLPAIKWQRSLGSFEKGQVTMNQVSVHEDMRVPVLR